jgi:hypothetical protein
MHVCACGRGGGGGSGYVCFTARAPRFPTAPRACDEKQRLESLQRGLKGPFVTRITSLS